MPGFKESCESSMEAFHIILVTPYLEKTQFFMFIVSIKMFLSSRY